MTRASIIVTLAAALSCSSGAKRRAAEYEAQRDYEWGAECVFGGEKSHFHNLDLPWQRADGGSIAARDYQGTLYLLPAAACIFKREPPSFDTRDRE